MLGLKDGESLGIITIKPKGMKKGVEKKPVQENEDLNHVEYQQKTVSVEKGIVSGGQTQEQIDSDIKVLVDQYPQVFTGLGKAKVPPVEVKLKPGVEPKQAKPRKMAIHLREPVKEYLEEMEKEGVVSRLPASTEHSTGWISNLVVTKKKWDPSKIRVNMDTRHMEEAIVKSKFPIPTVEELRHKFAGADRFSVLDLNHAFLQFEITEEAKKLFVFQTPWGLWCYNRLVMGHHNASAECNERIRIILDGIPGAVQIKDDVVVAEKGKEHDERLKLVLERFAEYNVTVRLPKCLLGQPSIKWFGNIFDKDGMSADPEKVKVVKEWVRPKDKAEVKSFLQTVQFSRAFMRPETGTYADVTAPLRALTRSDVRFKWNEECEKSFTEIKRLLCSEKVMAHYDPVKETRLYVDEGPEGVAATLAQAHDHPDKDLREKVWRPVNYTARSKTKAEKKYSKVEGESLGLLTGVKANKMYLAGTEFEVIVDHQPLVTLYNRGSDNIPERVARHKSKLTSYSFKVKYEPGKTNPSDYGSRHPPQEENLSREEKAEKGVEDEEEDTEVLVNRLQEVNEAVTLDVIKHEIENDAKLTKLKDAVNKGKMNDDIKKSEYREVFSSLSMKEGCLMRQDKLLIPPKLRPDVLEVAHEGHPGADSMLRHVRQTCWWPNMSRDVKEFVKTCSVGCAAAGTHTTKPPAGTKKPPQTVGEEFAADFKGPIGGKYYIHTFMDSYSRWPEVAFVDSTAFSKLKPHLERSFEFLGVPGQIVTDNGPPYQSHEWREFAKEYGFKYRPVTPLHPEANGQVERFNRVLVKTIHAAIAEGKDPKVEVRRRVLNYRNTPHYTTGVAPSELVLGRLIRTKMPHVDKINRSKLHQKARKNDQEQRTKTKEMLDKRRRATETKIDVGDQVLLAQNKSTTSPPFDPKPYDVVQVKHNIVQVERDGKTKRRHASKVKKLWMRPDHLKKQRKTERMCAPVPTDDDDDVDISVTDSDNDAVLPRDNLDEGEQGNEEQHEAAEQEDNYDHADTGYDGDQEEQHDGHEDDNETEADDDQVEEGADAAAGLGRYWAPPKDCGTCSNCLDKPKFGGPNTRRQACIEKRR